MELVEVVRAEQTDADTLTFARSFVADLEKTAIEVRDAPGFASSRLGVALGCEAMRMVETGVASVADIDTAMELGYRHPVGPLELTDVVGLDVRLDVLEHLREELGERFRPPQILRRKVRAGTLGKKTGEGFYVWDDGEAVRPAEESTADADATGEVGG
jgi:3-hydroxybutyryl-CoA dehydrogenase